MLELLKRALDWDAPDYSGMPDYSSILDHLGLTAEDHPDLVREAIEQEIEALEGAGEDADSDAEGGDSDVGL